MTDKNLIIIASQPRSGSTLLQALLSNNNKVATVSEPWLLLPFLSYNKPEIHEARYSSFLTSQGINDFKSKIDTKKFDYDLSEFLLKQYSQVIKNNEQYVLDKTPRYYEILDEIVDAFPNAKIIVLKRNPFAVLSSIIKTWNNNNLDNLLNFKRDLLLGPKLIQDFSVKEADNPNVYSIHYEDIVKNPKNEIKSLYNWLNLPFSNEVLDYSSNTKHIGQMGDPTGIHQNSTPNINSLDKWKEVYNDELWTDFYCGYAHFLTNNFLKEYGEYNYITPKKTNIFDIYLAQSKWNFKMYEVPLKKIILYRIFKKLGLIKY